MLTSFETFSFEARAYGLMLAFLGAALLAWQSRAAVWLAVAGACAVAVHSYALFALAALGCADLAASRFSWRESRPMLVALGLALTPLVLNIQLTLQAAKIAPTAIESAHLSNIWMFYDYMFAATGLAAAGVIVVLACFRFRPAEAPPSPRRELYAAVALLVMPIPIIALSATRAYFFVPRYGIAAVLGFAILAAWLFSFARGRMLRLALLGVLVLCFARLELLRVAKAARPPAPDRTEPAAVVREPLDVYVDDPIAYMDLVHAWPARDVPRVRYVSEPALAQQYTGQTMGDINPRQLVGWGPVNVDNLAALEGHYRQPFFLYYSPTKHGWLLAYLLERGAKFEIVERHGDDFLYRVRVSQ
jgi:hypothetical protein